ncbi:hypothetical protein A1QO_02670 [Vibrio genomosp. F10 str. ZF-129]|uniref:Uncharacterized protein n=1 Tax=Vibrio genomosp. F10 str. ZF-129 TaxID=1187848 RepID=A0A1E5BKA5_9VIBR|nr:hypothetical protein [Vibrio genomosp. F10]OEE38301.1 hypothetical protein A1QO_02670 [Vibrio genomosp. F10 str. ZF-129]
MKTIKLLALSCFTALLVMGCGGEKINIENAKASSYTITDIEGREQTVTIGEHFDNLKFCDSSSWVMDAARVEDGEQAYFVCQVNNPEMITMLHENLELAGDELTQYFERELSVDKFGIGGLLHRSKKMLENASSDGKSAAQLRDRKSDVIQNQKVFDEFNAYTEEAYRFMDKVDLKGIELRVEVSAYIDNDGKYKRSTINPNFSYVYDENQRFDSAILMKSNIKEFIEMNGDNAMFFEQVGTAYVNEVVSRRKIHIVQSDLINLVHQTSKERINTQGNE